MITFHLGVIDIPYEDEDTTTGSVAEELEARYQIMQTFFDRYGNDIAELMSKDLAAALENMFAGAPPAKDPLAESMSKVHDLFVGFLDNTEMNGLLAYQLAARLREYRSALKAKRGRHALRSLTQEPIRQLCEPG